MAVSKYYENKQAPSRFEVVFVDILLDQNNTDPNYGPVDFYTDPNSYDTPKTTDSEFAYNPDEPKKVYRFSSADLGPGAGVHFPILDRESISSSGAELKFGEISISSKITLRLFDIITNDTFELQGNYSDRRVRGSLLGKLNARNYIANREAWVYRGFIDPGEPFDIDAFEREKYVIKDFKRTSNGGAQVQLVDPVFKATKPKGKVPFESNGTLELPITDSEVEIIVNSPDKIVRNGVVLHEFSRVGGGAFPAATNYLKIDDEIIFLGGVLPGEVEVGDLMTFPDVVRGAFGTTPAAHDAGAKVEKCYAIVDGNPGFEMANILTGYFNIPVGLDPIGQILPTDWAAVDFGGIEFNGVIAKPRDGLSVLNELLAVSRGSIYWNPVESQIKLISQFENVQPIFTFDYTKNIQADSMIVNELTLSQKTRQTIIYGKIDNSKGDNEDNFKESFSVIDGVVEDESNIGVVNIGKDITTGFLRANATDSQYAVTSATKAINTDSETPIEFIFKTDSESVGATAVVDGDETNIVELGAIINVFTDKYIGPDTQPIERRCQITSLRKMARGLWEVKARTFGKQSDENRIIDFTIDSDYIASTENGTLDLEVLFGAQRVPGRRNVILIERGVRLIGTEDITTLEGIPVVKTGDWPDGLEIINRGAIIGASGVGGNGGDAPPPPSTSRIKGDDGMNGGDCIIQECDLVVDNGDGGIIWSGGGGGAGNISETQFDKIPLSGAPRRYAVSDGSGGCSGAGGSRAQTINGQPNSGLFGTTDGTYFVESGSNPDIEFTSRILPIDGLPGSEDGPGNYGQAVANAPKTGGDYGQKGQDGRDPLTPSWRVVGAGGEPGRTIRNSAVLPLVITSGNNSTQIKGPIGQ